MRLHRDLTNIPAPKISSATKTKVSAKSSFVTNEKFECAVCNTVFTSNKSLRLHMRMHDPVKSKSFEDSIKEISGLDGYREDFMCDICDKSYDRRFYIMHMDMHSDEPDFHCSICNKKFETKSNLEMHVKAHQELKYPQKEKDEINKKSKTGFPCGYCGKVFMRPHEKVKHERIHTGEKPHKCEVINIYFFYLI